jgi:membrane protein implicated in regulation of membrane protease activity
MSRPIQLREVLIYLLSLFRGVYPFAVAGLAAALLFLLHVPDEVLVALAAVLAVVLLVAFRYMDSKKMKQRTYETMSPEMKDEVDRERRLNLARRQKFLDAMEKAEGGKNA